MLGGGWMAVSYGVKGALHGKGFLTLLLLSQLLTALGKIPDLLRPSFCPFTVPYSEVVVFRSWTGKLLLIRLSISIFVCHAKRQLPKSQQAMELQ